MALPASGQISVSDILTELGADPAQPDANLQSIENGDFGTINTYNTAANRPNGSPPHSMSEWFSYDHNASINTHYVSLDGVNDYVGGNYNNFQALVNNDWSISCWVQNNESSGTNMTIWDFNSTAFESGNNNNRVFLSYSNNLNRFVLRVRSNAANFDRQWALHSNNGATGTGTSSGTKWTSSNRGNVNSNNFCHLVATYDASQSTGASAFKLYWNGTELTSQAAANNGTRTNFNVTNLALGAGISNTTAAGTCNIGMDEWALYQDVLTSSEVSTLYNSGNIANPNTLLSTNLHEVVSFADRDPDTLNGYFDATIQGGSTISY